MSNNEDENVVKELAREEMIYMLTYSYWKNIVKANSYLSKISNLNNKYLFAKNNKNEGFYLVWVNDAVSELSKDIFREVIKEAKQNNLNAKYHIYATNAIFISPTIKFYKVPDKELCGLSSN